MKTIVNYKNKIQLIGCSDNPIVTVLENGVKKAMFTITTTESFIDLEGNKIKRPLSHTCYAFDKLADIVERFVKNTNDIAVEGRLITTKQHTYINVTDMLLLGKHT